MKDRSFRKVGKTTFLPEGEKKNNNYLREKKRSILEGMRGSSSEKEHKENALASGADEGRDKLR